MLFNFRNKLMRIFAIYLSGVGALLFSAILYITKLSNYPLSGNLDYYLYLALLNIRVNFYDIYRIYNLGISILMVSSVLFAQIVGRKINLLKVLLMLVPIFYFLWANDPETNYAWFLYANTAPSLKNTLFTALHAQKYLSLAIFIAYLLMPFFCFLNYARKSKIFIKRKYAAASALCLGAVDLFILAFFVFGTFRSIFFTNIDQFSFPKNIAVWSRYMALSPVVVFVLIVLSYITLRYKPFGALTLLTQRQLEINSKQLTKDIRMMFHVYKNLFFTIERLALLSKEDISSDPEELDRNLDKIASMSHESVENISKTLDMLRDIRPEFQQINLVDCIEDALNRIYIPPQIKIIREFAKKEIPVYGDPFHLSEVFVNLFHNSLDALELKDAPNSCIRIGADAEDWFAYANIIDNGCGIDKDIIASIFNPLFSTKQSCVNSGIGLSYVKKILKIHNGSITVKSEPDSHTCFQIVLPVSS